ncbi:malonyl CoA-ACP transacylase [Mycobacterium sp. MBM]|nr:malonyl CoA-ACP transacylase [Mycobacterium sp. MBM]
MIAARVGHQVVTVAEIDEREHLLRSGNRASALPRPGTGEGRQLRRWLTQLVTAERVVALENADTEHIPDIGEILPDMCARLEIGSIAAAVLATDAGRAAFARVTAGVEVSDIEIVAYHRRNPARFTARRCGVPDFAQARPLIAAHLTAAARRRVFRRWLDARCAELVELAPGYEHPGDPRQPDNTHRH